MILADKGFAGREFKAYFHRAGVHLVRPDRQDEPVRHGRLARVRQRIEAVFDTLKGQLSLEQHGGRTPAGVFARTSQRLLALTAAIWHNWTTGTKTTITDRLRPPRTSDSFIQGPSMKHRTSRPSPRSANASPTAEAAA